MKNKIFIFIMSFIILPSITFTNTIQNYNQLKIHTINLGNADEQLGYNPQRAQEAAATGPTTFAIDAKGYFHICDTINYKIKKYTSHFDYINSINEIEYTYISLAIKILIDKNDNLVILGGTHNLSKINKDGNLLFTIYYSKLPMQIISYENFSVYDDYVFYYNDNNTITFLDNNGVKIETENFYNESLKNIYKEIESFFSIKLDDNYREMIKKLGIMFQDGKVLTAIFDKQREFFNILNEINEKQKNSKIDFGDKINLNDITLGSRHLIGYDADGNSYWDGITGKKPEDRAVLVCSKYGEALDCFYNRIKWSSVAVDPAGDVYFMQTSDDKPIDGINFYKVTRRWNRKSTTKSTTGQGVVRVTKLSASSYNTYKNMYTPLKAFDGDIKTAWLEAAKGPGIGESITLELDREITIDSIQVLPGLFDDKWWKSNNRVKSLIMKTDDSTTTLQFQDTMKPHKADFKEPKTFKKVEFIIKEVYPSGKDDDTAISEIQFYYKGDRIRLDFSKQEVK